MELQLPSGELRRVAVDAPPLVLGREAVAATSPAVSRQHLQLQLLGPSLVELHVLGRNEVAVERHAGAQQSRSMSGGVLHSST